MCGFTLVCSVGFDIGVPIQSKNSDFLLYVLKHLSKKLETTKMFKEKQMKATLSLKSMTWIFIDVEWKKKNRLGKQHVLCIYVKLHYNSLCVGVCPWREKCRETCSFNSLQFFEVGMNLISSLYFFFFYKYYVLLS